MYPREPESVREARPILLDLYCCEGGAARGYQRAGFLVLGIDLDPKYRRRYAGDGFTAMSALTALTVLITDGAIPFAMRDGTTLAVTLADIAAIHASPPCQHASAGTRAIRARGEGDYPALIPDTRALLIETGLPWVIENVSGADLNTPLTLCWTMFYRPGSVTDTDGAPLYMERHRAFESTVLLTAPSGGCSHPPNDDGPPCTVRDCDASTPAIHTAGSYDGARRQGHTPAERRHFARHVRHGGYVPDAGVQRALLGIDWMTMFGMYQSLPPVYTEHVGHAILKMP